MRDRKKGMRSRGDRVGMVMRGDRREEREKEEKEKKVKSEQFSLFVAVPRRSTMSTGAKGKLSASTWVGEGPPLPQPISAFSQVVAEKEKRSWAQA